jgi:invasion protein IalB
MKSSFLIRPLLGLALAAGLGAFAASAQDAPAPSDYSMKKVGDWTIVCTTAASQTPCEMTQGVADKNSGQRLLTISFVYVPVRDQSWVVIVVPLGVSIPKGAILVTDSFTSPKIPYNHCDRNGCYAQVPIDKNTLQTLGHSSAASIKISPDVGKDLDLRLSLTGFSDANDALITMTKQKAKAPPPAPEPTVIK